MRLSQKRLYQLRAAKQEFLLEFSNYRRLLADTLFSRQRIANNQEIRVAGLRRTGNHAVIGWIRAQHSKYALHFNHPPASKNPYQNAYKHCKKDILKQGARGDFSQQSLLIISYEDQPLAEVSSRKFELFHDVYVGRSQTRYDLLVLRDPFNLLASQLKSNMVRLSDESVQTTVSLWKSYAREFLDETQFLCHRKTCVNFNRWHRDVDYRRAIATRLNIEFTDAGREKVRGYGGGSSFDKTGMDGEATKMKLAQRWRTFEHETSFWDVFKDKQLLEYAEAIFADEDLPLDHVF
ncbi:hypothetical protein PN498_24980 [Oscillatoria sp. CS-180]|uniref:hypothetical protein n=1 Tax=Oscillatoria sp. CS-180 TaxID=3021720 RepID=UPI00232BE3B9|nr:hypothetical protein [Oscillatoria sp. CS-180]MDB9529271.1 hypothetical protein [Oscillatoria sp. CS-180]